MSPLRALREVSERQSTLVRLSIETFVALIEEELSLAVDNEPITARDASDIS